MRILVLCLMILTAMLSDSRAAGPADLPLQFTVKQRGVERPACFDGNVAITLDDITGGQVLVSVTGEEPRSMKKGDVLPFTYAGATYFLRLTELRNFLLDGDNADFILTRDAPVQERPEENTPPPSTI